MAKVNRGRPFRVDQNMHPINGSQIVEILNVAVTSGAWTPVQLPNTLDLACKTIIAKLRDNGAWRLSHLAAGTRYYTVATIFGTALELPINIVADKNEILFYAQSVAATGTLEVVLLD